MSRSRSRCASSNPYPFDLKVTHLAGKVIHSNQRACLPAPTNLVAEPYDGTLPFKLKAKQSKSIGSIPHPDARLGDQRMSRGHLHDPPVRHRDEGEQVKRLLKASPLALAGIGGAVVLIGATAAFAAWGITSEEFSFTNTAATLSKGNRPDVSAKGNTVTISWIPTKVVGSTTVEGYRIKRYDDADLAQQSAGACETLVVQANCTDARCRSARGATRSCRCRAPGPARRAP